MKDARLKSGSLQSANDSGNLRKGTASWLGRDGQPIQLASLYGLVHNPPEGSQVLLLPQSGQESNSVGLPDHPAIRPLKNLLSGEVGIANYLTGSYVLFKQNGDIEVVTMGGGDLIATVSGDVTATVTGNMSIAVTGNITMTGAQISLNGVTISSGGNIVTTGTVTADDFITT